MTAQFQHIVQKIFSKNSLEEVSLEELQHVVKKYPYFSIGHLLLSQKQKNLNNEERHQVARTTSMYFQDPLWLQWLLDEGDGMGGIEGMGGVDKVQEKNEIGIPDESAKVQTTEEKYYQTDKIEDHSKNVEAPIFDQVSENIEARADEIEIENAETPINSHLPENIEAPVEEGANLLATNNSEEDHKPAQDEIKKVAEEPPLHSIPPIPSPQVDEPAFEPYHTIDYFASQGIKISNEIKADDKFGQQLKSFTEWLKTMKRFPQPKQDEEVDEIEKSHIREIAEHSLEGKDVVTEAMAEVLLKQHRTEEARQVYEKLSLLNPSKSAYFAAKIEQLKEN